MNDNTVFRFDKLQDSLTGKNLESAKKELFEIMLKFQPYIRKNNLRVKIDGYRGSIKHLDQGVIETRYKKYETLPKRRAETVKSIIEGLAQNPMNKLSGKDLQDWRKDMSKLHIQTEKHPLESKEEALAHGKNRLRVEVNAWLQYD